MEGGEIMAYKESIAKEILELFKNAPSGNSTQYLDNYNQQDVADTMNLLNYKRPDNFLSSEVGYNMLAPIVFNK